MGRLRDRVFKESRLFSIALACLMFLVVSYGGIAQPANADTPSGPDGPVILFALDDATAVAAWTTVDDPVMGGKSTSSIRFGDGGLDFSGTISLENNGGFASARSPQDPDLGRRAAGATSLRVHAVGDGKTYLLKVSTAGQPWSYIQRFPTDAGAGRIYYLPSMASGRSACASIRPRRATDSGPVDHQRGVDLHPRQTAGPLRITVTAIDAA